MRRESDVESRMRMRGSPSLRAILNHQLRNKAELDLALRPGESHDGYVADTTRRIGWWLKAAAQCILLSRTSKSTEHPATGSEASIAGSRVVSCRL